MTDRKHPPGSKVISMDQAHAEFEQKQRHFSAHFIAMDSLRSGETKASYDELYNAFLNEYRPKTEGRR